MARQIEWTENAKQDLAEIIEYLKEEWSINTAGKFVEKLDSTLELLTITPYIGMAS